MIVSQITDQLSSLAEGHFRRRIEAVRVATQGGTADQASKNLLALWAGWTPDAFARQIELGLELAGLQGREAVFADGETTGDFAEQVTDQTFLEQIEFLRQKRVKPTKVWTDAMRGDHDRAFVVAGVTDLNMAQDFHQAIQEAARTWDQDAFAKDFDRIVEKYGWSYNGGRNWRIRTIFATNLRTSYMAGRLKQMRDPDVIRLRPYWQYRHGDAGTPLNPRPHHLAWDGMILMHDDPFWDTHFPPNDWQCSCGVRTVSKRDLEALGKDGPDTAPEIIMEPYTHEASGVDAMKPKGVGYGWDYQPGDTWERGLVPSALIDEAGGASAVGRQVAQIDTPEPIDDLIANARPFKSTMLDDGLSDEAYLEAFLGPFDAKIGEATLFEDKAGDRLLISDALFRARDGSLKLGKRGRARQAAMIAETILDPDEIWVGVIAKKDPVRPDLEELVVDRRYIRVDQATGLMAVFEIGLKFWEAVTGYAPTDKKGAPDKGLLDRRRGGKLLWKRK